MAFSEASGCSLIPFAEWLCVPQRLQFYSKNMPIFAVIYNQVHFLMPIDRHMHRCCTVTVVHLNYESLGLPYCSASAGHPKACVCGIRGLYTQALK